MRALGLGLSVAIAAVACSTEPGQEITLHGRIVFLSDTGQYRLHHMNPDGSDVRAIPVEFPGYLMGPAVSPDGRTVALAMTISGFRRDIFTVRADGTGLTQLRGSDGSDRHPAWSPDGSRIAFMGTPTSVSGYDIFVMNANGSGVFKVTDTPGADASPSWSPDGNSIAFSSNRATAGGDEIYTMSLEDLSVVRLTMDRSDGPGLENDYDPVWSPDGGSIAFVSSRLSGTLIYVMGVDGSDQRPVLPDTTKYGAEPSLSGDGTRLVYSCVGLCTVNMDGSGFLQLGAGRDPAWGPPE